MSHLSPAQCHKSSDKTVSSRPPEANKPVRKKKRKKAMVRKVNGLFLKSKLRILDP